MARITPPIGAKGLFKVRSPYVVSAAAVYWVGAVRTYEELIAAKIDPLTQVYTPVGLGQPDYNQDIIEGAQVITLLSHVRPPLHIPDTYILEYPNMSLVPHSWIVCTVSCGILPDTYDLTRMQQTVAAAVSEYTGVQSTVTISTAPTTDSVTEEAYKEAKIVRDAALVNKSTDFVEKLALQEQLDKVNAYVTDLLAVIDQQNLEIAEQKQTIADRDVEILALKQQIDDLTP
ncbi:hypothetical protein D3C86_1054770 [compost metagenome]